MGLISHYGQQGWNRKKEMMKNEELRIMKMVCFQEHKMCHRMVFERACVQRAVCVHRHIPESAHPMVTTCTFRVYRAWGATIIIIYLQCTSGGEESPQRRGEFLDNCLSLEAEMNKQFFYFSAPFIYSRTSLCLPLCLAPHE